MARVLVSASADADLHEILAYLDRKAGKRVAANYLSLFEALYERLIEFPASGAPRPALGPDIRVGIVPPYLVIYRHAASDVVTILRILHGRRRPSFQVVD